MSQRGLLIALVVSLAVNLFAVGAVVGALLLGPRIHDAGFRRGPPFWMAAQALPAERREAYHRALMGEADEVRDTMRAARRARREAWRTLGEPGYTPAATAARLQQARDLEMQARTQVERKILDFAATLPPAERAELAKGLEKSGPGMRMRTRHGPPPPP
jgi:uncharacterized membrane protein